MNGDEANYQVGFEERNFLGRAQFISFDYYVRDNKENYATSRFYESRVRGRPLSLELLYSGNPEGRLKGLAIGRPYYNLSQRVSFEFVVADGGGRKELFSDGVWSARWNTDRDLIGISMTHRWGPRHRKLSLTGSYRYVCQRTTDTTINGDNSLGTIIFPADSVYHRPLVRATYAIQDFTVLQRINGFEYDEDFTLGWTFLISFGRALNVRSGSYYHDNINADVSVSKRLGSFFFSSAYFRSFWFKGSDDIRRWSRFQVSIYNNHLPFMTVAARSLYVADKTAGLSLLELGGNNGLRGYPEEAFSGDRYHVTNIEARFFPGIEVLSVGVGAAAFADIGRTWQADEPVVFQDYDLSLGAGLRLSFEKLFRGQLTRFDFAHTAAGDWEIIVGTGQYF
ncbi:MAG: hypothetical protein DRP45_05930 [Candidatus Zixiibacteriota bacterium]|nr:MAG: hypothetical protein DRP45_05930 [candidate division Zixibacteria bacterium]